MSLSFTDNINSFNVSNVSVSQVSNHYAAPGDRFEILAWLSPLEPRIRHQDIRTRRADNVGEWLLQTDEFQRWCDGAQPGSADHATLFCCGGPAVLSVRPTSVDGLCDRAKEQNIAVACFYVDFAAREEQSPTNILGSLLKQIIAGLEMIPEEIRQTFQDHKKVIGGRGLRVPGIVKMLQAVTSLQQTFICVDALDECMEWHRPEVLDSLRQILEKSPNTRIFLTGRQHIRGEIDRHLGGRTVVLSIKPNNDDIVKYIQMRLSKDTSLDAMDSSLEAEIIEGIAKNIPETFLLISLTMDAILGETTAYGRRQRLGAMAEGLDLKDVYGATLERIKEQGRERARLGMAALMWISHSQRLLQLDDLSHALAVEIGSPDLNPGRIPSVETLLSCCLGLVVIDREASTVRLIHYTLQEYLCAFPDLFGPTHSIMAEICLTYMNFRTVKEIPPTLLSLPPSVPFLKYSSLYWGAHARREASRGVVSLALELFSHIESHVSTKLLLVDLISMTGRSSHDIPTHDPLTGFTGLHCASLFGILEIAASFIGQPNPEFNKKDFLGITPLIWAAICGHEGVAKLLLEQRTVNPDKRDGYFRRTALLWAAEKGHEGIVRLLLGWATSKSDGTDGWWGRTPQAVGMAWGRRYVDPNRPDKYGQTAILLAAEEEHEAVVKLLLGRKDVKPDTADGYGRTPLLWASSKGRQEVVKLLLERKDITINRRDKSGETPLLSAAEDGSEAIVGLLLERKDINPNIRGKAGQTPLSLTSSMGHGGVVKLLLGREDINPNKHDKLGRTPLWWAAFSGSEGVVKLLLERGDVNPNMPDKYDRTPLWCAAINGSEGVVELLLEREDINPDIPNKNGETPLWHAATNEREGVVRLLLGREDVNPNMPDKKHGITPLWYAADIGSEGVAKLLLEREDVNPNMPNKYGWTPLMQAAENQHGGVVKLLLEREDVNPNILNKDGRTPLWYAANGGEEGVVKPLLEREDINPNIPDENGATPLSCAAFRGNEGVVKLLLEQEDINPDIPDKDGQTPLWRAASNGSEGVVKLLLEREGINPNIPDKYGRTPLSLTAENGHDGVVELLQARISSNLPLP